MRYISHPMPPRYYPYLLRASNIFQLQKLHQIVFAHLIVKPLTIFQSRRGVNVRQDKLENLGKKSWANVCNVRGTCATEGITCGVRSIFFWIPFSIILLIFSFVIARVVIYCSRFLILCSLILAASKLPICFKWKETACDIISSQNFKISWSIFSSPRNNRNNVFISASLEKFSTTFPFANKFNSTSYCSLVKVCFFGGESPIKQHLHIPLFSFSLFAPSVSV